MMDSRRLVVLGRVKSAVRAAQAAAGTLPAERGTRLSIDALGLCLATLTELSNVEADGAAPDDPAKLE